MEKIRVGIIGMGSIATYTHIPSYQKTPDSIVTAVCDTNDELLQRAARICGLPPERCFKRYQDLIDCNEVDVVDICTPNYIHCEIASEAIRQGKPFSVEKPLGMNYKETAALYQEAVNAGIPGVISFSWRYRPYIRFMKWIVDKGELGELYHIYVRCIKSSGLIPGRKLEWRFIREMAGTGVLGDLASHMFDMVRFLGEEFKSVSADTGIIIKERQKINSDEVGLVTTDDWCNILANMESGANATFQISRCATNISDWIQVELYGSKGSLSYCYKDGDQSLEICTGEIDTIGAGKHFIKPPKTFDAVQSQAFINVVRGKDDGLSATIKDGVICQRILDATLKAAETKRWVDISEIQ